MKIHQQSRNEYLNVSEDFKLISHPVSQSSTELFSTFYLWVKYKEYNWICGFLGIITHMSLIRSLFEGHSMCQQFGNNYLLTFPWSYAQRGVLRCYWCCEWVVTITLISPQPPTDVAVACLSARQSVLGDDIVNILRIAHISLTFADMICSATRNIAIKNGQIRLTYFSCKCFINDTNMVMFYGYFR